MRSLELYRPATTESFHEQDYLAANLDVALGVCRGDFTDGRHHFDVFGYKEDRRLRLSAIPDDMRAEKLARLLPHLADSMPHEKRGLKYDFLTPDLREKTGIQDTGNVGENEYDGDLKALIDEYKDGLILDCGSGRRTIYYTNVVNYDIVDYDTTDVIGVGEMLPFKDESFDGVFSIAVLEHVRDPFRCAAEIIRVLKPGGKLIACVPFLQPYHGYPHHYYNMTHQGLSALFERGLTIDDHRVLDSILPVGSLTWIVQSWAAGLPEKTRESFLDMPLRELMRPSNELLEKDWVRQLPTEKNFELASATTVFAHKPLLSTSLEKKINKLGNDH